MKLLFTLLISTFALIASAQDGGSWKVTYNNRTVLSATKEDTTQNKIRIKRSGLKHKGYVVVNFTEGKKQTGWDRTITINGDNDAQLISKDGHIFKIANSKLYSLTKGQHKLTVYTIATPSDPKMKALVRVRRVQLCSIQL